MSIILYLQKVGNVSVWTPITVCWSVGRSVCWFLILKRMESYTSTCFHNALIWALQISVSTISRINLTDLNKKMYWATMKYSLFIPKFYNKTQARVCSIKLFRWPITKQNKIVTRGTFSHMQVGFCYSCLSWSFLGFSDFCLQ